MNIIDCNAYKGRNIYSHFPVIKMVVDLENLHDTPSNALDNFNERLLTYLPELKKHECSKGYEGGFVERLIEGTYLGHITEHVAIEIQNKLGYDIRYGKTRQADSEAVYNVIYAYTNETAGIEAGKLAVMLINSILENKKLNLAEQIEKIKKMSNESELGTSTASIKSEAEKRNIPVLRIGNGSLLQLGYGKNQKRIQATLTENSSCISVDISCNKTIAKSIMSEYGIPVPEGKIVRDLDEALAYCEKIGYPVVVKPNCGNQGKGVSVNLKNPQEVSDAYQIAMSHKDSVLIEKYIKGNHYRIMIVGNEVVAASQRVAAHVIGDGFSSIRTLIEKENQNPLRGDGHEKPMTKIIVDKVVELYLKKQNLSLDDIPSALEVVFLRENDNLSTGGIAIDVTDEIHIENKRLAALAAKVIGLDVAGVDITTSDISKSILENHGAIIEINAAPGIRMHHFPAKGKPRNVAKAIVDMLCPEGHDYTVPIISVTGTNGKTTTARILSHIIRQKGINVGMCSTSGIYINDRCINKGDNSGPISARTLLMDKTIDCAVLETARGGILKRGLGYDLADVGIVTNISEDHLGLEGIHTLDDLTFVKALVVEALKITGYAILNADDPYCIKMQQYVKANIIYFSSSPENPIIQEHIANGGTAIYADDGMIFLNTPSQKEAIAKINDIPITLKGILKYNIANVMAAIAGAYGAGIQIEDIRKGVTSFIGDKDDNPGRFSRFDINGITVVLDYGHNIDAFQNVIDAVLKMKKNKLIGVIGVPGDRTDTSTYKIGQLSGNSFDRIYIKEDKDRRGREIGAVAKVLKDGCNSSSISPSELHVEFDEVKALKKAILTALPGDIIVVFYEHYEPLLQAIEKLKFNLRKENQIIA